MNAAIVKRAEAIFSMVLDAPAADREAMLDDCCGSDAELRALVIDLLTEDSALGTGPLDSALAGLVAPVVHGAEQPRRIGRFEIVRTLGEGGMAVVYEARQNNPRRTVALKVVRLAGLASRDVLRRFLHEVQVLGELRHHGIAQIYDAGVAPGARGAQQPYFAMELVRGDNLLAYARRAALSIPHRLELLARVCDAVEYAHQRGVIHRDLKPANIIVDESSSVAADGSGGAIALAAQPKVLDFGVARVIGQDAHAATMNTRAGQVVGTLAYMSPEQLSGEVEHTDTRSDVYALGVMLYQLLVDRLPHEIDNIPLPEIARRVRETEAPMLGVTNPRLRGDIEIIAARALEKDPARRYQSARDLAADLRRHLRGEAIEARRDSAVYVLRKSIHRHRGVTAAASLVLIGLVAFSIYAWAQARRLEQVLNDEHSARVLADISRAAAETSRAEAEDARKKADSSAKAARAETAKAKKVSAFLGSILRMAGPTGERKTKTLVDLLDEASAKLEKGELRSTPEVEEEVRMSLARTYCNLDLNQGAVPHFRWLAERARAVQGEDSKEHALALSRVASAMNESSLTHEGEPLIRRAVAILERVAPGSRELINAQESLANTLMRLGRCEEALPFGILAAEGIARFEPADSLRIASARFNLAGIYRGLKRTADMVREYEACKPIFEKNPKKGSTIRFRYYYATDVLAAQSRHAEAVTYLRFAESEAIRLIGHDHPETLGTQRCLARALIAVGEADAALAIQETVVESYRAQPKWVAVGETRSFTELAVSLARRGEIERARDLLEECQEKTDRITGRTSNLALGLLDSLASIERDHGDPDRAAAAAREYLHRAATELDPGDDRAARILARACQLNGQ